MDTVASMLLAVRKASKKLLSFTDTQISTIIREMADALILNSGNILEANARDLARMDTADPKYDRLKLTADRIEAMAGDMRNVASLPSPLCEIDSTVRPNGLLIRRVAVPFGVIGIIYEARPNVTSDVASLCLKSGNACVLKGGHEASSSNAAIVETFQGVLARHGITDAVTLLPPTRDAAEELMNARGIVDVIIPRGSAGLIQSVRRDSKVPVIETGAGVCHCYIDAAADAQMAAKIVNNAKTRRVSVCNALDCALIHSSRIADLPTICAPLAQSSVVIHADNDAYRALTGKYPENLLAKAEDADFGHEYLGYEMAVRTVESIDEALDHIERYGSGHSESIVTADNAAADKFRSQVDAACVYVNAPTSFSDGAQFGLGAEIGISTQKLHARGPMGLRALTTYKWLITGEGQIREK